jgi:hypothetical protein
VGHGALRFEETAIHCASGPNFTLAAPGSVQRPTTDDFIAPRAAKQTPIGQLCRSGIEIVAWPV